MKKLFCLLLALTLIFSLGIHTYAAEKEITVLINGIDIKFDVPPQIIGDRTMVPMRKTFEALGAKIEWVGELRLAIATYQTTVIAMPIDAYSFSVTNVLTNETREISLDVPAQIVNDRTLIPLRAVSEALGKDVAWDGSTRTATIRDKV